jgi:hypothetical protein
VVSGYLCPIVSVFGCQKPFVLVLSLVMQPIMGFEFLRHYQEGYGALPQRMGIHLEWSGASTMRQFLQHLTPSLAPWKLWLCQAWILRSRGQPLLGASEPQV